MGYIKNGEEIVLVEATLVDAEEMAKYAKCVFSETEFLSHGKESNPTKESQEKYISLSIENDRMLILLAKIDNKIVGMGNITQKSANIRFCHRAGLGISVLKDWWGKGIASALMIELIKFAKKTKYEQIELSVVDTNVSAIALYKKFNFIQTGTTRHAMKYSDGSYADFIEMQLDLKEV